MLRPGGLLSPTKLRDWLQTWPFWRMPLAAVLVLPAGLGWFWVKDNPVRTVRAATPGAEDPRAAIPRVGSV